MKSIKPKPNRVSQAPLRTWALFVFVWASLTLFPSDGLSYDLLGSNKTYLDVSRWHAFAGTSFNRIANEKGVIDNGFGLGMRLGFGYKLTRKLHADFVYQLTFVPIRSPNPLGPGTVSSKLKANHEYWRLRYLFDYGAFVPYFSIGAGMYQIVDVNSQTGFGFSSSFQLPMSVGFETYILGDLLSIAADYTYHFLFSEQQEAGVLSLVGVPEVSFNFQSIQVQMIWHFF